jgi:hypothetical protein
MRRNVAQQLRFDNATDWAAVVGVLLLPLIYCAVVVAAGLEPGLHESGVPFSADHASRFCIANAICWLAIMLIAAWSTRGHAYRVLRRHSAQLKQMLQEHVAPEAYQPLDSFPTSLIVSDTAKQGTVKVADGISDLGLRFGQWCRLFKEQTAGPVSKS